MKGHGSCTHRKRAIQFRLRIPESSHGIILITMSERDRIRSLASFISRNRAPSQVSKDSVAKDAAIWERMSRKHLGKPKMSEASVKKRIPNTANLKQTSSHFHQIKAVRNRELDQFTPHNQINAELNRIRKPKGAAGASSKRLGKMLMRPLYSELSELNRRKLVSNVLKTPFESAPDDGKTNVGVSFRTDARGKSHEEYDKEGITAMNSLPGLSGMTPVSLPKGAKGEDSPDRSYNHTILDDVHMLFIPGSPYRNQTQTGRDPGNKADEMLNEPTKKHALQERSERSAFEKQMIQRAKTLGMPVMSVCAGTWSLVDAYGGEVETLPENERRLHKAEDREDTWTLSHDLATQKGTVLDSFSRGRNTNPESHRGRRRAHTVHDVNSTHWAVVKADERGKLTARDPKALDPNDSLEVGAWAKGDGVPKSVEGVSSKSGAPVLGLQWHPESYLPNMPGEVKGRSKREQEKSVNAKRLFTAMGQAAQTYKNKRSVVAEIKQRMNPV